LPDSNIIYGRAKALSEISGPQCITIRSSFLGPELENPTEIFSNLVMNPEKFIV